MYTSLVYMLARYNKQTRQVTVQRYYANDDTHFFFFNLQRKYPYWSKYDSNQCHGDKAGSASLKSIDTFSGAATCYFVSLCVETQDATESLRRHMEAT